MKHLILGAGNLGLDLKEKLLSEGHDVVVVSQNDASFNYPVDSVETLLNYIEPEFIWNTIGAGSVEQSERDLVPFIDLHVRLVADLTKHAECPVINFSSDYAASESQPSNPKASGFKSRYAMTKNMMENVILFSGRKDVKAIRVSSLYGKHKPAKTYPVKIKNRENLAFSLNECTPTPTAWLAKELVNNLPAIFSQDWPIVHFAPAGRTSYADWASLILGEAEVKEFKIDNSRPVVSNLGNSILPKETLANWKDLWDIYKSEVGL